MQQQVDVRSQSMHLHSVARVARGNLKAWEGGPHCLGGEVVSWLAHPWKAIRVPEDLNRSGSCVVLDTPTTEHLVAQFFFS